MKALANAIGFEIRVCLLLDLTLNRAGRLLNFVAERAKDQYNVH